MSTRKRTPIITDYTKLQIGDKVRYTITRDPKRQHQTEYHTGTIIHETRNGWVARPNDYHATITGAVHGVTETNYIAYTHKTTNEQPYTNSQRNQQPSQTTTPPNPTKRIQTTTQPQSQVTQTKMAR